MHSCATRHAVLGLLCLATTLLSAQAPLKAPSSLKALSATRSEVRLAWDASAGATGYTVETLAANRQWTPLPTSYPDASATIKVEPFTTYTFRVRAAGAGGAISEPSNAVTVGPPPTGFHLAAATPKGLKDPARFAAKMVMALDDNGDPALAYMVLDPNNDDDLSDSELHFLSWNRAAYQWNAPVKVDTIGEVNRNGSLMEISLALDASTHRLGVAYMAGEKEVRIAFSDDGGATWKAQPVFRDTENVSLEPSLGLAGGRVFLAYLHGNDGLRYQTGAQTEPPDKWSTALAPKLAGTGEPRPEGISLSVDSAGTPAVAYPLSPPEDSSNLTIAFWRPGGAVVKVADSANRPSDDQHLKLVFQGTQPAVVMYLRRDDRFYQGFDQTWVARSTTGGASWDAPVALPNDGGQINGFPVDLSVSSTGRAAVTVQVEGGDTSGTRCGLPKLAQSGDFAKWTICSPGGPTGSPGRGVSNPQVVFAGNDKLYVAYVSSLANAVGIGIHLWREP